MTYELALEKFQGPLDKLLELIEERKLEITEISLAEVTDDFLKYLGKLKAATAERPTREDIQMLADFVVTASRLIFIKSKSLLPEFTLSLEEEAEIKDLEARLLIYREFKPALKLIHGLWLTGERAWSRPYFSVFADGLKVFYPGETLDERALAGSLGKLFQTLEKFTLETAVVKEKIISLEAKIQEDVARNKNLESAHFSELTAEKPRGEIIITFLALLHLAREQLVYLEQAGVSDIIVKRGEGRKPQFQKHGKSA